MRIANRLTDKTNLYEIIYMFVDKLIELIEFDEQKLKRIRIQVTKLQTSYPYFVREQIAPTSLLELREACIASAYIPLLSNYNNQLYYTIGDSMYCVDGGFMEHFYTNENTIRVPFQFLGLKMPMEKDCKARYKEGLQFLL